MFDAWLKTEIALAKAQEQAGVIPKGVADRLQQAASVEKFDSEAMQAKFKTSGFPVYV